ncbi:MAG: YeeE/YedE family protein [Polyangiaceae bacterium]|nr:YeeE/YedE family protein [Polyangiaceae bacterium]
MSQFTPISALAGGALIGLAVSLFLLAYGRIAGISGVFGGLFDSSADDKGLRLTFLAGLVIAGLVARVVYPSAVAAGDRSLIVAAVAGLIVGVGTQLGNGCTSGHGVCGVSRMSRRSIIATLTFIATGMLTVAAVRMFGGGAS